MFLMAEGVTLAYQFPWGGFHCPALKESLMLYYNDEILCVILCVRAGGSVISPTPAHRTSTVRAALEHGRARSVCGGGSCTSMTLSPPPAREGSASLHRTQLSAMCEFQCEVVL